MKTLIERLGFILHLTPQSTLRERHYDTIRETITALREQGGISQAGLSKIIAEQQARIEELEEDQRKGEFMVTRERGRIEELEGDK